MVFGFLDESDDPAPEGGSKWLVVVILATEYPRLVAQQVKRMRRALGKRVPGELKARFTAPRVVERFMKMLALTGDDRFARLLAARVRVEDVLK